MSLYPWQQAAWQPLWSRKDRLPHALLIHGKAGLGQEAFARQLAQALLCSRATTNGACGQCQACMWFQQDSHPDFRQVGPGGSPSSGADEASDKAVGSRIIKVDQIRDLVDFVHLSSHQSGYRIVLLYPADRMNQNAANSLLKILEEPPAQALLLLVTDSPGRLLPTIRSRCQQVLLTPPLPQDARQWLADEGVPDPTTWLAFSGNAPLLARSLAEADNVKWRELAAALVHPRALDVVGLARALETVERRDLVQWLVKWMHDAISMKLTGSLRFYIGCQEDLQHLVRDISTERLLTGLRLVEEQVKVADHPSLNNLLFTEQLLVQYKCAMTGEQMTW